MPTLHLLRHAKSSWDDLRVRDHDRPLTERGERAASAMAAFLRQNRVRPDLVLCSSARRTVDTLAAIRPGMPETLEVETRRDLYEVDSGTILSRLHKTPDSVGVLLLIGHNPGLEDLATSLAGPDSLPAASKALGRKFSTGALATLEFEAPWTALTAGSARLTRFITPKDLV